MDAGTSMLLEPVIPDDQGPHPALLYLAMLSSQSRRTMRGALDVMAAEVTGGIATHMTCPWSALRYQNTRWLRSRLVTRYKPTTANRHLAALRGVLRQCFRLRLVSADDYHRAIDFRSVVVIPRKHGLRFDDIEALFVSCDEGGGPQASRDAAVLALLYGAGLRRSELVALDLLDYHGASLAIHGDGADERVVPLSTGIRQRIDTWLDLRGRGDGPLFCRLNKNGEVRFERLGPLSVLLTCHRRADAAGIDRFSARDLRSSFMKDLLDAGADIVAVRRLTGNPRLKATAFARDRSPESTNTLRGSSNKSLRL